MSPKRLWAQAASLSTIADVLHRARRVLILCHVAPDGDAVGSLLGLGWLLRSPTRFAGHMAAGVEALENLNRPTGPMIGLACADSLPPQLRFLPGAADVLTDLPEASWDVVVALDASDPRRLGNCFRPAEYGDIPIINLDHHSTNLFFGTLNYVDPEAAATAQIIVELADAMHAEITQEVATCLLTGLVTDTLSFRTNRVTPHVMKTAARLMEAGADLTEITDLSLNQVPLTMMRLWGCALTGLHHANGVVWASITQEMRSAVRAPETGDGGLVSFLINAPDASISAVFSEKADGQVEIGFRSRNGWDVAAVALELGGGGHPQAAGCTVPGPIVTAEERVLPLLFALCNQPATTGDNVDDPVDQNPPASCHQSYVS